LIPSEPLFIVQQQQKQWITASDRLPCGCVRACVCAYVCAYARLHNNRISLDYRPPVIRSHTTTTTTTTAFISYSKPQPDTVGEISWSCGGPERRGGGQGGKHKAFWDLTHRICMCCSCRGLRLVVTQKTTTGRFKPNGQRVCNIIAFAGVPNLAVLVLLRQHQN